MISQCVWGRGVTLHLPLSWCLVVGAGCPKVSQCEVLIRRMRRPSLGAWGWGEEGGGLNGGVGPLTHLEEEQIFWSAYGPLRVVKAAKH